jgi:hypothetical protein
MFLVYVVCIAGSVLLPEAEVQIIHCIATNDTNGKWTIFRTFRFVIYTHHPVLYLSDQEVIFNWTFSSAAYRFLVGIYISWKMTM